MSYVLEVTDRLARVRVPVFGPGGPKKPWCQPCAKCSGHPRLTTPNQERLGPHHTAWVEERKHVKGDDDHTKRRVVAYCGVCRSKLLKVKLDADDEAQLPVRKLY